MPLFVRHFQQLVEHYGLRILTLSAVYERANVLSFESRILVLQFDGKSVAAVEVFERLTVSAPSLQYACEVPKYSCQALSVIVPYKYRLCGLKRLVRLLYAPQVD